MGFTTQNTKQVWGKVMAKKAPERESVVIRPILVRGEPTAIGDTIKVANKMADTLEAVRKCAAPGTPAADNAIATAKRMKKTRKAASKAATSSRSESPVPGSLDAE